MNITFHFSADDQDSPDSSPQTKRHEPQALPTSVSRQKSSATRPKPISNASVKSDDLADSASNRLSLPVRVTPLPGESISSFMWRAADANGMSYHTWSAYLGSGSNFQIPDWDRFITATQLQLLALVCNTPINKLESMTLQRDGSHVITSAAPVSRHVLPLRGKGQSYSVGGFRGLQFCPDCFREDDHPYLRKHWRYSYVSVCEKHSRLLTDHCPHCGERVRPHSHQSISGALWVCSSCGESLAAENDRPSQPPWVGLLLPLQAQIVGAINENWTNLHGRPIHCSPYLDGVRVILKFILSPAFALNLPETFDFHGKAELCDELIRRQKQRNDASKFLPKQKLFVFELLSPKVRALALLLISHWLQSWPISLGQLIRSVTAYRMFWHQYRMSPAIPFPHWLMQGFDLSAMPLKTRPKLKMSLAQAEQEARRRGYYDLSRWQLTNFNHSGLLPKDKKDLVRHILSNKDARRAALIHAFRQSRAPKTIDHLQKLIHQPVFRCSNEKAKTQLRADLQRQLHARINNIFDGRAQHRVSKPAAFESSLDYFLEHFDLDDIVCSTALTVLTNRSNHKGRTLE